MQSTLGVSPPSAVNEDKHDPKTCPFCPDEDEKSEANKLDNSSSKLKTSTKKGDTLDFPMPGVEELCVIYTHPKTGDEDITGVTTQPHHCIPGKEALKGDVEHPILEFIESAKGTITDDIGYNVNHKNNGVWLVNKPVHFQAGKKIKPASGMNWGLLTDDYPDEQHTIAVACMQEGNRQFHDRHPDYSSKVSKKLSKMKDSIIVSKASCPIENKNSKPDIRPPLGLIKKMDNLSKGLAGKLVGHPRGWKKPYFTSRFAEKVINDLIN